METILFLFWLMIFLVLHGFFLEQKDQAFSYFNVFRKRVGKEKHFSILRIRSDIGGEIINHSFITYYEENGIMHELSCLRTPQQNRVIERKNCTFQEMVSVGPEAFLSSFDDD